MFDAHVKNSTWELVINTKGVPSCKLYKKGVMQLEEEYPDFEHRSDRSKIFKAYLGIISRYPDALSSLSLLQTKYIDDLDVFVEVKNESKTISSVGVDVVVRDYKLMKTYKWLDSTLCVIKRGTKDFIVVEGDTPYKIPVFSKGAANESEAWTQAVSSLRTHTHLDYRWFLEAKETSSEYVGRILRRTSPKSSVPNIGTLKALSLI